MSVEPELVFDAVRHIAGLGHDVNDRWLGYGIRRHLGADMPDDIIALIIDRAVSAPSPPADEDVIDTTTPGDPLADRGIGTARGACAEALGNILVYDSDGHRTALVAPALSQLAGDLSLAVRACAAHAIAASLRFAPAEAIAAFRILVQADDRLLASGYVERLIFYIGNRDLAETQPIIERMLRAADPTVRQAGGRLATYAASDLQSDQLLAAVRTGDAAVRSGATQVAANRLRQSANRVVAGQLVTQFVDDPDEGVRDLAAGVAAALRGSALRPFQAELEALIGSKAFTKAVSQLLITLENAPDRVNDLILLCARRFVEVFGTDTGDIATAAAAEAGEVGGLLLRAYAQAADSQERADVLVFRLSFDFAFAGG